MAFPEGGGMMPFPSSSSDEDSDDEAIAPPIKQKQKPQGPNHKLMSKRRGTADFYSTDFQADQIRQAALIFDMAGEPPLTTVALPKSRTAAVEQ